MDMSQPLTELRGIGEVVARKFAILGLRTVGDLIDYYPRRYEDYSTISPLNKIKPGIITIEAVIKQVTGRYVRRGLHITEAIASDQFGSVRLIWFNQPYRAASLKQDQTYYVSGNYELSRQKFAVMNPSIELVSAFPVNTARIIPIYKETKGLSSSQIRNALKQVVEQIRQLPESLPDWIIENNGLMSRAQAIESIHFPASSDVLDQARHRLGFEEVFNLILASLLNKKEIVSEKAPAVEFNEKLARDFVHHLTFNLTDAQRKVIWQIFLDIQKTHPMNRMVEGDVGSGKTVVAAMASVMVMHYGHQVAFMAPTELLARQHASSLQKLLKPLGLGDRVGLLVGSLSQADKDRALQAISTSNMLLIVGTHALIQESVDMHNLELVVIDEQHRFGVDQRKALMAKAGHMPHVLSLTATPIPRSLALTLYGELDISILDEKPSGRVDVLTKIVSPNSTKEVYEKIIEELKAGRQMFVVCPMISESGISDAKSVEEVYERLTTHELKNWKVGLLHGRMKADAKNEVMQQFVDGKIAVLVSTTVIEVGVDVPNAAVMVIENAERFGLAQIHQLRGRVGRGKYQGYCYLMLNDSSAPSKRLRALEASQDGFKLAELDLTIRGPGSIYGISQHGELDLRVANLTDVKLITQARTAAQKLIERGINWAELPELKTHVDGLLKITNLN